MDCIEHTNLLMTLYVENVMDSLAALNSSKHMFTVLAYLMYISSSSLSKMNTLIHFLFFREWTKRTSEDQARKLYDQAMKLELEFGEFFTGCIFFHF